jgi:competence protein ComEA
VKKLLLVLCTLLMSIGTAWAAVNANTASVDELQTVTGIGPTIAQRIVDERKKGPFKDLADLEQRVKGVGESSIRKMAAGGLTVGGASRAKPKDDAAAPKRASETAKGTEKSAEKSAEKGAAKASAKASDTAAAKASDTGAAKAATGSAAGASAGSAANASAAAAPKK